MVDIDQKRSDVEPNLIRELMIIYAQNIILGEFKPVLNQEKIIGHIVFSNIGEMIPRVGELEDAYPEYEDSQETELYFTVA